MDQTPANDISPDRQREGLAFIWKNITRISDCMLITRDDIRLRGRPMRGLARQDENVVWFITAKTSHKDDEIAASPHVCLCYSDMAAKTYVSLSGTIELIDETDQILALWNSGAEAYFPNGPDDPNILLLKFTPDSAEYWDAPSNPVVLAVQFIKSKVTGEPLTLGENRKVSMA